MKKSIKVQITMRVGITLFIGNMLLVLLLFYNFNASLAGFLIPIDNEIVQFYFDDGLEAYLLAAGITIAVVATAIGTSLTYMYISRTLKPIEDLANHMKAVNKQNIFETVHIPSNSLEAGIIIESYNTMSQKLLDIFNNQKHLSSFIAHEFRSPLAIIRAKIDLYNKDNEKNTERLIEDVSEQTDLLNHLITQILNLSEIQRTKLKDTIPLDLLMEEVIEDLSDFAERKKISVLLKHDSLNDNSLQIIGNHNLLYQAFFNIVENGIKYNKENGKVIIEISSNKQNIHIKVSDTGCGISKKDREKIFLPFYRSNIKDKIDGSGIGLTFSKMVFEHHNSTITLMDSGFGCCFDIVFNRNDK